jgi:two-component system, chemotaxis family, protein-glutamate methylesterase/glutaminase
MNTQSPITNHQSSIKRVVIVEDSLTIREYLAHIIDSDPALEVVGMARDGEEGVKRVCRERPDIVTMDIHMPRMNGYEATQRIMAECPVPIVIVTSSWHPDDVKNTFWAIDAGALTALEKPPGPGNPRSKPLVAKLLQTIKTMSEVRVVKRFPKKHQSPTADQGSLPEPKGALEQHIDVVAIGASTGGPPVIRAILSGLRQGFSIPVLVVQHISPGFLDGMVGWLDKECGISVKIGSDGEPVRGGVVYFAPDGVHMGVNGSGKLVLSDGPLENGVRPSVSHLFRSVAEAYGQRAVGVLLSGMGRDGAADLALMRERGAITVAQDKESCVVYGMPAEAVKLNGAGYILPPERIAALLNSVGKASQSSF